MRKRVNFCAAQGERKSTEMKCFIQATDTISVHQTGEEAIGCIGINDHQSAISVEHLCILVQFRSGTLSYSRAPTRNLKLIVTGQNWCHLFFHQALIFTAQSSLV